MTGFIHTAFLRTLFFISLCFSACATLAEEVSIDDSLIQSIFPKATHYVCIVEKLVGQERSSSY